MAKLSNLAYRINTEFGIYIIEYLYGYNTFILSLTLQFPSIMIVKDKQIDRKALYGFVSIDEDGTIKFYSAQTFKNDDILICKNLTELYIHIAGTYTKIADKALYTLISEAKRCGCKIIE